MPALVPHAPVERRGFNPSRLVGPANLRRQVLRDDGADSDGTHSEVDSRKPDAAHQSGISTPRRRRRAGQDGGLRARTRGALAHSWSEHWIGACGREPTSRDHPTSQNSASPSQSGRATVNRARALPAPRCRSERRALPTPRVRTRGTRARTVRRPRNRCCTPRRTERWGDWSGRAFAAASSTARGQRTG